MKITTDNIDYNTVRLIRDIAVPWEMYERNDDTGHQRLVTLGYIEGVIAMADTMKEVLKA